LLEEEMEENYDILQTKQWRLQMVYEIAENDFGQCEIGTTEVQERLLYKAGTIITMKYAGLYSVVE
jgi:hypothetical protein